MPNRSTLLGAVLGAGLVLAILILIGVSPHRNDRRHAADAEKRACQTLALQVREQRESFASYLATRCPASYLE